MKSFLSIFLLFFCLNTYAQFNTAGKLYYEEEMEAKNSNHPASTVKQWLETRLGASNIKASKIDNKKVMIDATATIAIQTATGSQPTDLYFVFIGDFSQMPYQIQINHLNVGPTQLPVEANFIDFDSFKKEMHATVDRLSGEAKSKNQAILNDQEKLNGIYEKGRKNHQQMLNSVKQYITELIGDLKTSIK